MRQSQRGHCARIVVLLAAPLLWLALAVPVSATQLATWAELAPSVEPYDNPFDDMPFEQMDDLRTIHRAEMMDAAGRLDEATAKAAAEARRRIAEAGLDVAYLFAQREFIMQRRKEAATGVTETHLDQDVMMDGYALPLRAQDGRVVEFLLVPWIGACIHTPPPAPNQIVHVEYPEGFEAFNMFTPIRLEGRLTHRPTEHDLFLVDGTRRVPASYAMEQAVIRGTPGEIVAADTAVEDLSSLARAQAWITDIFTAAMTDMERDRSAGAIGLAVLIAFAYGALHTLGPGHGKAVVVSYFIGTGGSLRRGAVMGVRIAVMHVLSAIVVVFLLDFAVRQATGAAPSDYRLIRLGSYALIVAIGAVMLWHALANMRAKHTASHAHGGHEAGHDHAGCVACSAANAKQQGGGWIAAAVGVVPCTGALIVMLFGLANNLVIPAVIMVIAISAGMALAMAALGIAAILGRNWAEARIGGSPGRRLEFDAAARLVAAACVLAIGSTMFAATFAETPSGERAQQASAPDLTEASSRKSAIRAARTVHQ